MTANTTLRQSLADNCRELAPINNPAKVVLLNRSHPHRNTAFMNAFEGYDRVQVGWRVKELRTASGHTIPALSVVQHSPYVSDELKRALLTPNNIDAANLFHRVEECGELEVYDNGNTI